MINFQVYRILRTVTMHIILNIGAIAASNWNTDNFKIPVIHTVQCNGSEESILDCEFSNISNSQCGRYHDASVVCQGLFACVLIYNSTSLCHAGSYRIIYCLKSWNKS